MLFAHGGGGPANFEALVLAIPMVVVGVMLFVQKTAKPIVPIVLVLSGFLIGVGSFTVLKPADEEHTDAEIAYGEMLGSMCEASEAAADGDVSTAETLFLDDVHLRLHGLADSLTDDRTAAAELLEAKQAVEADFEDGAEGEEVAEDLDGLLAATTTAFDSLELEVEGCE